MTDGADWYGCVFTAGRVLPCFVECMGVCMWLSTTTPRTVQIGHKDFKLVLCQEYFISSAVHKALQPHTNHLCVQKYIENSAKYQRHMLNLGLHHCRRKSGVYRFNQSHK